MMAGLKKWTSISEKTPNHKSKVRFLQFVCFSQEINSCFFANNVEWEGTQTGDLCFERSFLGVNQPKEP